MPKVSVIIPVYNVERYLGECLDSILGQTLADLEVICVDDGSTDNSRRILADYATKDTRVKVAQLAHAGAFRARQRGICMASGEFLYFMDADDLLDKVALQELYGLADRENLDQIVFGATVFCEDDVSEEWKKKAIGYERYYAPPSELCGMVCSGMDLMAKLVKAGKFHVSPPLRLVRTSVFKEHEYGFPDATSRADNYFTPLSLYYSRRAVILGRKYYRRRMRLDSISTAAGSDGLHFKNMLNVIVELCRFEPFARELLVPESAVARFIAKRIANLHVWSEKLDPAEQMRILAEIRLTDVERGLLAAGVLPLLRRREQSKPKGFGARLLVFLRRILRWTKI